MNRFEFRIWNLKKKIWEVSNSKLDLTTNSCCHFISFWKMCKSDVDIKLKLSHLVIQQFTGLKDSKGKKIFEGDIIIDLNTSLPDKYRVIYNLHRAAFQVQSLWNGSAQPFFSHEVLTCNDGGGICSSNPTVKPKIIGNIFENSELLK